MAVRKTKSSQKTMRSLEAKDFYSDFSSPDMLYAALVRSPASDGVVKEVRIPNLDDDYFLFTEKDIPKNKTFTVNGTEIPIFAHGKVLYRGEPLGIVCGPDLNKVMEYCENAEIIFDINSLESAFQSIEKNYRRPVTKITGDLDLLVDVLNEMPALDEVQSSKSLVADDDFGVIAKREVKTGLFKAENDDKESAETLKAYFSESEDYCVFEDTWTHDFADPLWPETTGAFCYSEAGILHVYTTTKWSYMLLNVLSQTLDIPPEKVHIHKTKSSGLNSNGIWRNAKVTLQTALASKLTKHPVKLVFNHQEQTMYMRPGVQTQITYKTSVEKNTSKLKAMDIKIEIDVGARNPFAEEIVDRIVIGATNIYHIENLHITATASTSQTPPTSVYAKTIDSQSFFSIENHISRIATSLHRLPDELRLINLNNNSLQFPIKHNLPYVRECMETVMKAIDFNRKFITYGMEAENRLADTENPFQVLPMRGIGLACAYNGSGFFGKSIFSGEHKIEVTLMDNGAEIHSVKPSGAVEALWKKIVSDKFSIPEETVRINSDYLYNEIPNLPEETSSNITIMTSLLEKCCSQIAKKRNQEPLPITSKKTVSPATKKSWNAREFSGTPFHSTSFGACTLELEVDSYTYAEKIKQIHFCIDCGNVFDQKAAERTVKLAVQQELTNLVEDEAVPCDSIKITFIPSKSDPAQIGELVHNTLPAAFSSALSLALNTHLTKLPCTQNLIYSLIQNRHKEINLEESEEVQQEENQQ